MKESHTERVKYCQSYRGVNMSMILIVGGNCPKCHVVKARIPVSFNNVLDMDSADAKVELAMRDLENVPLSVPLLLTDEDYISGDTQRIIDRIKEEYE